MTKEQTEETVNERIKDPEVMTKLLDIYRTDKLCSGCGKGIETDREVDCRLCDIKKNARVQLDFIETGAMNLGYTLGIKRKPKPHVIRTPVAKPKKRARKTTAKPKGK